MPFVENGVLLAQIDRDVLSNIDRDNCSNTCVGEALTGLDEAVALPPNMQINALLAQTGMHKFLVDKDQRLWGVMTLANLTLYLPRITNLIDLDQVNRRSQRLCCNDDNARTRS